MEIMYNEKTGKFDLLKSRIRPLKSNTKPKKITTILKKYLS
nr:MAG TPA_asm: hypothetical protein [Caudoviricetes sp.]